MNQVTKLNFKGQSIFLGIDVHLKSWHVSIYTQDLELSTKSFPPCAKILGSYLKRMYPGAKFFSVYEAGYCGYWIHENLMKEGIQNIIVNPADVPTKDKEKRRKNDSVDSRKLARSLRSGELEGIFIPDKIQQEDKLLIRTRRIFVKRQVGCKNQIKSTLGFFGIILSDEKINSHWSKAYINYLRQLCEYDKENSRSVRLTVLLDLLEQLRKTISDLTRKIRSLSQQSRYKNSVDLLITIPGISILSAMIILTEFGDIKRYRKLDSLCSYAGIIPNEHSTSDNEKNPTITKRGNKYLKKVIVDCTWVAVRKDPELLITFKKYQQRNPNMKSIIKVSRKYINIIRSVLINEKPYQTIIAQ